MKKISSFLLAFVLIFTLPEVLHASTNGETNDESSHSQHYQTSGERRVDPSQPMIALTFDDGPARGITTRILDVLEAYGGRATFFVVGSRINANRSIIERMHENGFEVVGHSWNHSALTRLTDQEVRNQILNPHEAIEAIVGSIPQIYRPPYGAMNDRVKRISGELGFAIIHWSVDPRDWEVRNATTVTDRILRNARDGDIVVLHDIHATTATAMERVVPELVRRGYQLVTVSELFHYRGIVLEPGVMYHSAPPGRQQPPPPEPTPTPTPTPQIYVNGESLVLDVYPVNVDGSILVPVRQIAEVFDAKLAWESRTKMASVTICYITVILQIGNSEVQVINYGIETVHVLDLAPMLKSGRMLVPLQAIGEIFHVDISWQEPNVIINTA